MIQKEIFTELKPFFCSGFVRKIKNFYRLKRIKKELKKLDEKYYAIVWSKWMEKGYADSVSCFPNIGAIKNDIHYVSLSKGISLVLANNEELKNIFLSGFSKKDAYIVRDYVKLMGFSVEAIKTDLSNPIFD